MEHVTDDGGQNAAEEVASDGGTPPDDARNAAEDDKGKLIAALQEKASRVNDAEANAKLAEAKAIALQAQLDALTRSQSPAANGSDPRAERQAALQKFANGMMLDAEGRPMAADPVAQEVLELREQLGMAVQEIANLREIDRIKDEDEQKEVLAHFNANRNRLGDVKAARAEVREKKLEVQLSRERQEAETLRASLAKFTRAPDPNVVKAVPTHVREVSAAEHMDVMTRAEFDAKVAEYDRAEDQGDGNAAKERMALKRRLLNNKMRIEG